MTRPYEMPLYPAPPVLGIALNLLLGVFISWQTWALGAGWLGLGVVVHKSLERIKRERDEPDARPTGTADQPLQEAEE